MWAIEKRHRPSRRLTPSKAGFPLQISTGVRCRYALPKAHKNTANGLCLRLVTAFDDCKTLQK